MLSALLYAHKAFEIIQLLITVGGDVKAAVDTYQAAMATMLAEKREPTATEWDTLNAQALVIHNAIQNG